MDKNALKTLCGFCALILCAALIIVASSQLTAATVTPETPDARTTPLYTVKEYNGSIGVFYGASDKPALVYDIPVYTLPDADRQLLKDGISAESSDELNRIIEDYTG